MPKIKCTFFKFHWVSVIFHALSSKQWSSCTIIHSKIMASHSRMGIIGGNVHTSAFLYTLDLIRMNYTIYLPFLFSNPENWLEISTIQECKINPRKKNFCRQKINIPYSASGSCVLLWSNNTLHRFHKL